MKKLYLLSITLLIAVATFAQSTVTITGSTINVNGTSYNVGSVYYVENYSNGTLQIKDRYSTTLILGYEKATNVINGTTGVVFTSQSASETYLVAGGVGSSSSSSGGGSGSADPVLTSISNITATTTPTALTSSTVRFIEVQNNRLNSVDLWYYKSGDNVNYTVIPTGSTKRIYVTNPSTILIQSSIGTQVFSVENYN